MVLTRYRPAFLRGAFLYRFNRPAPRQRPKFVFFIGYWINGRPAFLCGAFFPTEKKF